MVVRVWSGYARRLRLSASAFPDFIFFANFFLFLDRWLGLAARVPRTHLALLIVLYHLRRVHTRTGMSSQFAIVPLSCYRFSSVEPTHRHSFISQLSVLCTVTCCATVNLVVYIGVEVETR